MPEFTEFFAKTQDEILTAVKRIQDNNLKAMTALGEAASDYATKVRTLANGAALPTPAELVESTFGFTAQLLELQKAYYVKIAEAFAAAQKKTFEPTHSAN